MTLLLIFHIYTPCMCITFKTIAQKSVSKYQSIFRKHNNPEYYTHEPTIQPKNWAVTNLCTSLGILLPSHLPACTTRAALSCILCFTCLLSKKILSSCVYIIRFLVSKKIHLIFFCMMAVVALRCL